MTKSIRHKNLELTSHISRTLIIRLLIMMMLLAGGMIVRAQSVAWQAGTIVSEGAVKSLQLDDCFAAEPLSDATFRRMQGKSWKAGCTQQRSDLRYLRLLHRNADGQVQRGEMVVNRQIAERVVRVFRRLYEANYRIERMVLVDDYDANDERSMQANNTSAFNFRFVKGTRRVSKHGRGLAIDINPRYNPCVKGQKVEPANGRNYAYNRDKRTFKYKIDRNDPAYRLFKAEGFSWGGDWKNSKDYQHFEYNVK